MKELKFRVWDKEQKEFLKYCVLENDGTIMQPTMANGLDFSPLDSNRYEITQSTGLKDCRGQEIYEGDYVRILRSTYLVKFDTLSASFKLFNIKTKKYKNFYQNLFTKNLISGRTQQYDGATCKELWKKSDNGVEIVVLAKKVLENNKWYYFYSANIKKFDKTSQTYIEVWKSNYRYFVKGDEKELAEKLNSILAVF